MRCVRRTRGVRTISSGRGRHVPPAPGPSSTMSSGRSWRTRLLRPGMARFWYVSQREAVVGVAIQPPVGRVLLTPMPPAAARSLAQAMEPPLLGVYADAGAAATFASEWTLLHHVRTKPIDVQTLYGVATCRRPRKVCPAGCDGGRRPIDASSSNGRGRSSRTPTATREQDRRSELRHDGRLWVWETDRPVAMAGVERPLGGVAHIATVYTPEANRARGYATAIVTSLTRSLLADGLRCVLADRASTTRPPTGSTLESDTSLWG